MAVVILCKTSAVSIGRPVKPIATFIDHTALAPDTSADDIIRLCAEAVAHGFHCVCVAPMFVELAVTELQSHDPMVASVIGFPHGNTLASVKAVEAESVLALGARELDMVMARGKSLEDAAREIRVVADLCERHGALLKVIIESAAMDDKEIIRVSKMVVAAGGNMVKTSTGFGPGGASVAAVTLIRRTVPEDIGVKASGGIRDFDTARAMIAAGANRIGCSASVNIVEQEKLS